MRNIWWEPIGKGSWRKELWGSDHPRGDITPSTTSQETGRPAPTVPRRQACAIGGSPGADIADEGSGSEEVSHRGSSAQPFGHVAPCRVPWGGIGTPCTGDPGRGGGACPCCMRVGGRSLSAGRICLGWEGKIQEASWLALWRHLVPAVRILGADSPQPGHRRRQPEDACP